MTYSSHVVAPRGCFKSWPKNNIILAPCTTTKLSPLTMPASAFFHQKRVDTQDLIKPNFQLADSWSAGMISALIFQFDAVFSQKFLNKLNARKDWALWSYSHSTLWGVTDAGLAIFAPWSIRIRRFFKLTGTHLPTFTTIEFRNSVFFTPKRRIKRWLKKKYTTQTWR